MIIHFMQMMRLLLQCRSVQRNEVNGENLTFLDILRNQGRRDAGGDLREDLDLEQIVAKTWFDILKSPFTFLDIFLHIHETP